MKARHLIPILPLCLCGGATAEMLELEIVSAGGYRYAAKQELDDTFEAFESGAIPGEQPPREYKAIRCDGPWGALKYSLTLPSGPGYQIRANDDQLTLQIVEHAVVSVDANIDAMEVHCIDSEPKQVVRSLAKIELERGSGDAQQLVLAKGYRLEYRYTP
ncbi:hypothetical protein [Microbulbifer halophilus]|uniref:Uncharacterized protein n=1 Tax=Microbulbifer halophilus TaxID=453963 RepID=A0ABW5EAV3_9GAMM|nr:hypothetical protein [Microbulbifer halophilus]MCW8125136.1 hypothetical protein [Microbulbifer halophilus]